MIRSLSPLALTAVVTAACCLTSCGDDAPAAPSQNSAESAAVLDNTSHKVILAAYSDLDEKAATLANTVTQLDMNTTEENLQAARTAWREARRPWEQSEAFLFGPVDTKGIDPGIDSWPVNTVDLDAVLSGNAVLTKDYIDGLEGTLKGFHTIEYLLFGSGIGKKASDLTDRELEYLGAVTLSFRAETTRLRDSWATDGENYAMQLAAAGSTSSIYASQKDALQELINGMIGICDEVANGKIADPFSQQDRTLEESQFSDNSIADFQDNIRSVRNIYLGQYGPHDGKGISDLVASRNAQLDASMRARIDAAIAAIGAMQPSFGEAIFNNKTSVETAQEAVRQIQIMLEGEIAPVILGE